MEARGLKEAGKERGWSAEQSLATDNKRNWFFQGRGEEAAPASLFMHPSAKRLVTC